MALLDIQLGQISEADLEALITSGARESSVIDYKRGTYGGADGERAEFLADLSSFANTLGGDLVIGLREQGGVPVEITAFEGDADAEVLRLENMARAGLEPRLSGLQAGTIPIAAGGHVIILRTRRSFGGPHRVIFGGRNRFWARASSGKYEPNVDELRRLFTELPLVAGRLRDFRDDRLAKILARSTPSPIRDVPRLVIHLVPVPAFTDGRLSDVVTAVVSGTHIPLPPGGPSGGLSASVNLDGFLNSLSGQGIRGTYAQLFRSGAIEGVAELCAEGDQKGFSGPSLANMVVGAVKQYVSVAKAYDAGEPMYAFLAICGADGSRLRYRGADGLGYETQPFEGDLISLPEVLLDETRGSISTLLRPALNTIWNAYGQPMCDVYNGQGTWMGTT